MGHFSRAPKIWAVQDKLALDAGEEVAIELKRELVCGQERVVWNVGLSLQAKDLEFSELSVARLRNALQGWDSFSAGADRRWLQPLIDRLFPPETSLQSE